MIVKNAGENHGGLEKNDIRILNKPGILQFSRFPPRFRSYLLLLYTEDPWRYRNKAQFPWGINKEEKIITGFYAGRTHSIIENEDCLLGIEENQVILKKIREHMEKYQIQPYEEEAHKGLMRHTLIRKGFQTGETKRLWSVR